MIKENIVNTTVLSKLNGLASSGSNSSELNIGVCSSLDAGKIANNSRLSSPVSCSNIVLKIVIKNITDKAYPIVRTRLLLLSCFMLILLFIFFSEIKVAMLLEKSRFVYQLSTCLLYTSKLSSPAVDW